LNNNNNVEENLAVVKNEGNATGESSDQCVDDQKPEMDVFTCKALFTRDIWTDNIAIKRYCDKKILR